MRRDPPALVQLCLRLAAEVHVDGFTVVASSPVSTAITGILVAVVAGVFGVGGAVLSAHREHRKWLREKRLESYTQLLVQASDASGMKNLVRSRVRDVERTLAEAKLEGATHPQVEAIKARVEEAREALATIPDALDQACVAVELLGPPGIQESATQLRSAALKEFIGRDEPDREGLNEALYAFLASAQRALGAHR